MRFSWASIAESDQELRGVEMVSRLKTCDQPQSLRSVLQGLTGLPREEPIFEGENSESCPIFHCKDSMFAAWNFKFQGFMVNIHVCCLKSQILGRFTPVFEASENSFSTTVFRKTPTRRHLEGSTVWRTQGQLGPCSWLLPKWPDFQVYLVAALEHQF